MNQYELLLKAVEEGNVEQIRALASSGLDINCRLNINSRCDDGASILFSAVLQANVEVIRALLALGADPNFQASEPALSIYADTPLDVALQARNLMNWEKFDPIVHLLIDSGARGYNIEPEKETLIRQRVLEWQQNGKQYETQSKVPDTRMPNKAIFKRKIFWLVVFGIGITVALSLIPNELLFPHPETHEARYKPLGLVLLTLSFAVLMAFLQPFSMLNNPCFYFLVLGAAATLAIERLIGASEKNKNSYSNPSPSQEPDSFDQET
jgi:Ankyrin repeat